MRAVERRLLGEAAAVRPLLVLSVTAGVLAGILLVPQAWLMAGIVADAFLGHVPATALAAPALLVALAFAARGGLGLLAESAGQVAARRVRARLRRRTLESVLGARPSALAGEQAGELVTTLTHGVEALDAYFGSYLPQLAIAVAVPLVVIAWTVPHDLVAAAIMVATVPLVPVFMALIGLATRDRSERRWRGLTLLGAYFLDLVRGLPTLRAFGRGADKVADVRTASDRYRQATMDALRGAFLSSLVLELAAAVSTALVAVAIGLRLDQGRLDLQTGLAVLILTPEVYLPLRRLGAQYHATQAAIAPAERLFELETALAAPPAGIQTVDLRTAAVELRSVSFGRADRGVVLEGADLRVRPGEHVALIGPSGAGKSTILALLLGFERPDQGAVMAGGIDLRDLDLAAYRSQVAWQSQRPVLLAGTLDENLRLARAGTDRRQRLHAAEQLGLNALLDREVGEGGRRLSAGQRQRAGLARAILRDAPLMLLDEPTAHLDALSAQEVTRLLHLWRGRTVIVATHSAEVARACGRVYELSGGRLREVVQAVAV